jgi:hypothetical protein
MGYLTTRHSMGMFDDSHWHFFAERGTIDTCTGPGDIKLVEGQTGLVLSRR